MKKIIFLLLGLAFIQANCFALSCPTPGEYQDKLLDQRNRAMNLMQAGNVNEAALESLLKEQERYGKSSFNSCVSYFQTSRVSYDCKRLQTIGATYLLLDEDTKAAGKAKINNFSSTVKSQCPIDYKALQFMMGDYSSLNIPKMDNQNMNNTNVYNTNMNTTNINTPNINNTPGNNTYVNYNSKF